MAKVRLHHVQHRPFGKASVAERGGAFDRLRGGFLLAGLGLDGNDRGRERGPLRMRGVNAGLGLRGRLTPC